MKRIDFLISDNPYGSTIHFSKSLSAALNRQGVKSRLFWVGEGHFFHAFYEISADPPDLTCSFSDIRGENQTPLGDLWQIPHLSYLIDPAIYFLHHLKGKYSCIASVDEGDCHFIRSLNFKSVFFLPHGVDRELATPIRPNRIFEVVLFGTCIDYEAVARLWKERYSPQLQATLHEAAARVLSDTTTSTLLALTELNVKEQELPLLHHEVDRYTRGKDRVELIRALQGHRVHIWGEGPWRKYLPDAEIHPPIAFDKTVEIMKQAKVVLNSSPRFKRGSHERILYALTCGCLVLAGESTFVSRSFIDQKHLLTYRYGQWENKLVDFLPKWQEIAAKGQEEVLRAHTWDARAKKLLSYWS